MAQVPTFPLPPSFLAKLVARDWKVRMAALETLSELEPATLAQHADAVLARIQDIDGQVRTWAIFTLGKLEPATLVQHAPAFLAKLGDSKWYVRRMVVETLGKLEPAMIAKHAAAVAEKLDDPDGEVRSAVLDTLGKLEPATLAQHVDAVLTKLDDPDENVRRAAVQALGKLEALVKYTQKVIDSLRRVKPDWVGISWIYYPDLHPFISNLIMGVEGISPDRVRARLRWLQLRALFRAQRLAQRWLAYTYEPGRPGYFRNLEEFSDLAKVHRMEV